MWPFTADLGHRAGERVRIVVCARDLLRTPAERVPRVVGYRPRVRDEAGFHDRFAGLTGSLLADPVTAAPSSPTSCRSATGSTGSTGR
jgi:hypothetical protein